MHTFNTTEDAKKAGWYHINANAVLTEYSNNVGARRLVCRDISGGNSFGYGFKIVVEEMKKDPITGWEDWYYIENENEVVSSSIYLTEEKNKIGRNGCSSVRFKMSDIERMARLCLPHEAKFRMFNLK